MKIADKILPRRAAKRRARSLAKARRVATLETAAQRILVGQQADDFRRRRNRAFEGIVTLGTAKRLHKDTRDDVAQERLFAGADNRMRIAAAREARAALEATA